MVSQRIDRGSPFDYPHLFPVVSAALQETFLIFDSRSLSVFSASNEKDLLRGLHSAGTCESISHRRGFWAGIKRLHGSDSARNAVTAEASA